LEALLGQWLVEAEEGLVPSVATEQKIMAYLQTGRVVVMAGVDWHRPYPEPRSLTLAAGAAERNDATEGRNSAGPVEPVAVAMALRAMATMEATEPITGEAVAVAREMTRTVAMAVMAL
jgi:hypothetical protein